MLHLADQPEVPFADQTLIDQIIRSEFVRLERRDEKRESDGEFQRTSLSEKRSSPVLRSRWLDEEDVGRLETRRRSTRGREREMRNEHNRADAVDTGIGFVLRYRRWTIEMHRLEFHRFDCWLAH